MKSSESEDQDHELDPVPYLIGSQCKEASISVIWYLLGDLARSLEAEPYCADDKSIKNNSRVLYSVTYKKVREVQDLGLLWELQHFPAEFTGSVILDHTE